MRGIADGASDAGARWENRRIDLIDVAVANTTVELGELAGALKSTATGLEGLPLDKPPYAEGGRDSVTDHCSAFAATGRATRDGKMVITCDLVAVDAGRADECHARHPADVRASHAYTKLSGRH